MHSLHFIPVMYVMIIIVIEIVDDLMTVRRAKLLGGKLNSTFTVIENGHLATILFKL